MATDEHDGAAGGGPTVVRMLLGAQLRTLREAKGISREKAGYHIRGSDSKISRMELGRVGFKMRDITDLLSLYGVEEPQRSALTELAARANAQAWWQGYSDVTPTWFQSYLGLEAEASLIRTYEAQYVPGLLQTPAYARAMVRMGNPGAAADEVDRRVDLRIRRQDILSRDRPPQLWAMLDEAVLRRMIGGKQVMADQIRALISAAGRRAVRVQILPFSSAGHAAVSGAFSILRFAEQDLPDLVYVEHLAGATYLDKREAIDVYGVAMEQLVVAAYPPDRTIGLLREALREVT